MMCQTLVETLVYGSHQKAVFSYSLEQVISPAQLLYRKISREIPRHIFTVHTQFTQRRESLDTMLSDPYRKRSYVCFPRHAAGGKDLQGAERPMPAVIESADQFQTVQSGDNLQALQQSLADEV